MIFPNASPDFLARNPHMDPNLCAKRFDDCAEKVGEAKSEKQLQNQLHQLLLRRGHRPSIQRMDRKSNIAIGSPDIQFSVNGRAVYWEVKFGSNQPTPEQTRMMAELESAPNNAICKVIRSYREGLDHLREVTDKFKVFLYK